MLGSTGGFGPVGRRLPRPVICEAYLMKPGISGWLMQILECCERHDIIMTIKLWIQGNVVNHSSNLLLRQAMPRSGQARRIRTCLSIVMVQL